MNKIEVVREYIDDILLKIPDVVERRCAYVHLYGVAQTCAFIALKRGENVELAIIAGMLHDIHSYAAMDSEGHARKSALLAKEILAKLQITTDDESRTVCDAISAHSDKGHTHSTFDEVLKDADTFQSWLYNPGNEPDTQAIKERLLKVLSEFGIGQNNNW